MSRIDSGYVYLNQSRYINEELTYYGEESNEFKIPASGSADPATPMFNSSMNLRLAVPNEKNKSLLEFTGKLRYIVDRTRPGCLNAVGEISGGGNHPSDLHCKTGIRLFLISRARQV